MFQMGEKGTSAAVVLLKQEKGAAASSEGHC